MQNCWLKCRVSSSKPVALNNCNLRHHKGREVAGKAQSLKPPQACKEALTIPNRKTKRLQPTNSESFLYCLCLIYKLKEGAERISLRNERESRPRKLSDKGNLSLGQNCNPSQIKPSLVLTKIGGGEAHSDLQDSIIFPYNKSSTSRQGLDFFEQLTNQSSSERVPQTDVDLDLNFTSTSSAISFWHYCFLNFLYIYI